MARLRSPWVRLLTTAAAMAFAASAQGGPEPAPTWKDVSTILQKHCTECHGPEEQAAGLRLDRRADLLGEVHGNPVVVPGNPDAGRLIPAITGQTQFKKSRLTDKHRLPDPEIAQLRAWIAAGAK